MTGHDELDAELTRLFADERLDVRPSANATEAIVAGARRVRRRRVALTRGGGAAAVVAIVAGGALLAGGRGEDPGRDRNVAAPAESVSRTTQMRTPTGSAPEVERPASSRAEVPELSGSPAPSIESRDGGESVSSTAAPRQGDVLSAPVLGPEGYKGLRLNMSYDDAVATGLLAAGGGPPAPGTCDTYRPAEGAAAVQSVTISGESGVVQFTASSARTTEGMGAGSSVRELRATYPELAAENGGYSAPAGAGARYQFATEAEQVTELRLTATDHDC